MSRVLCKAGEVGKIVINKCLRLRISLDVQKLQKLLVLMQVECIRRSGKPLFKEDIVVWDCGVIIKEVDEAFRYELKACEERQTEYIALLEVENESVNYVLNTYGDMNSFNLNDLHVNQKVIALAVKSEGQQYPFVSWSILIGAFKISW